MENMEWIQVIKDVSTGRYQKYDIDEYFEVDPLLQYLQLEKAHVTGVAKKQADSVNIEININMPILVECDRCLEETQYLFDEDVEILIDRHEIETFDFRKAVEDEIILARPIQILCSQDCLGLCPDCAENLNVSECKCNKKQKNSPFDVLDSLFD